MDSLLLASPGKPQCSPRVSQNRYPFLSTQWCGIWTAGTYSYSVRFTQGSPRAVWGFSLCYPWLFFSLNQHPQVLSDLLICPFTSSFNTQSPGIHCIRPRLDVQIWRYALCWETCWSLTLVPVLLLRQHRYNKSWYYAIRKLYYHHVCLLPLSLGFDLF